tara:strand:+ start:387 stop:731 length:345 start_codon:yes stop_codon:yes gene_type:complete
MSKKKSHKYNVGDIVTFKFLTGDILTGKITECTNKDDGTPDYKIRVEDSRGFTIYPCMTDSRIIKRNKSALSIVNAIQKEQKKQEKSQGNKVIRESDLDKAINSQKDFLNGSLK